MEDRDAFRRAVERFDAISAQDPVVELWDGQNHPRELLYSRRMAARLQQFAPDASEALRLASHCQHLKRWEIPRAAYPMDRAGYHHWRTELARLHAQEAGRVLEEVGYDPRTIARVQSLVRKERLKTDPEAQLLEDVICLVFLEFYFPEFSGRHDEQKVIGILQRTWRKMSARGQAAALAVALPGPQRMLLEKALSEG